MLHAESLHKRFGRRTALDGFSLDIAPGEVVGLIGHNGAGKTTFVEIVTGLTRPDAGSVTVAGRPVRQARAEIGYAPQEMALYPTVTVRHNLAAFGRLYGLHGKRLRRAIDETAEELRLTAELDRPVGELSGGQRRRVQAATALLHHPALLLLDEPTAGADPITRSALLEAVGRRAAAGTAVLYTTHYLPELDELDATIAVAARGQVIARGDRAQLCEGLPSHATIGYPDGTSARITGADPIAALVEALHRGPAPATIDLHRPSLDDLYLALSGPPGPTRDPLAVPDRRAQLDVPERSCHAI